ncbi:MAG: hypothetical protein HZA52_19605 [Planctomycetes bacterium]|nr:hypothetical protein [Planctomycetota bacterium]
MQNEVHDAGPRWVAAAKAEFKSTRLRATLAWCAGLLFGGGAAFLVGGVQQAFGAVICTCVLAGAAACARPALGCLVAIPIWLGAAATYLVVAGEGEWWPLGLMSLGLALVPSLVVGGVVALFARRARA